MIFPNIPKFFKSMSVAVWRWWTGAPVLVPPHVEMARNITCNLCDRREGSQCKDCTCYLPLKTKFSHEKCPRKKWDVYKPSCKSTD